MARVGRKRKDVSRRQPGGQPYRPQVNPRLGCSAIYIIERGPQVKVGLSVNPNRRISELQTSNGEIVRLYWMAWFSSDECAAVERAFHKAHQGSSIHSSGEWYYLPPAEAVALVQKTIAKMGASVLPEQRSAA